MRGASGSGKSYDARQLAPAGQIFSADDHHMVEGRYEWSPERLHHAHNLCFGATRDAMRRRLTPLVVDNTNVRMAEIFPYLELALQYGYKVEIREPTSPWWVADVAPYLENKQKYRAELERAAQILFEKGQHGVPLDTILNRMLLRWHTNVSAEEMLKTILRRK